jgi:nitrate/TMAO reductase-like tetraheme cytochrome c subunit
MNPEPQAVNDRSSESKGGRRRRTGIAGRALILLLLFNAAVLAAFTIDRRSRSDAEFCANCHNMTTHVDSYLNSNHMDSAHRRANVGCKDCHADYTMIDEVRSVVAYVLGDYEEVFHRRKFNEEMCNGCHVGMEYQAARTDFLPRNPHRGHYPDLRCSACHLAHAQQVDLCGSCHDNGGQRMTGQKIVARAVAPWERVWTPGAATPSQSHEKGSVDHELE